MAEVTNELMYELLKRMHADMGAMKLDIGEVKHELNAMRGHMVAMQSDINNIYGILARHDQRLDRIEHRLELRELAETGSTYDPTR